MRLTQKIFCIKCIRKNWKYPDLVKGFLVADKILMDRYKKDTGNKAVINDVITKEYLKWKVKKLNEM